MKYNVGAQIMCMRLYFMSLMLKAWRLRSSIAEYLNKVSPIESNGARSFRRIGRLAFWLCISALAIIVQFFAFIIGFLMYMDHSLLPFAVTPLRFYMTTILMCISRISISHAQARNKICLKLLWSKKMLGQLSAFTQLSPIGSSYSIGV